MSPQVIWFAIGIFTGVLLGMQIQKGFSIDKSVYESVIDLADENEKFCRELIKEVTKKTSMVYVLQDTIIKMQEAGVKDGTS